MIKKYWFNIEYPDDTYSNKLMQIGENEIAYWVNSCKNPGAPFYLPHITKKDLSQEFRLHIWSKLKSGKYDPRLSSFRTWCSRVLRNKVLDMGRHRDKLNKDVLNTYVLYLYEEHDDDKRDEYDIED